MTQKIIQTGNSLCLTIPAQFAKILGVRPGQTVRTKVDLSRAALTHIFSGSGQLPLLPKTK